MRVGKQPLPQQHGVAVPIAVAWPLSTPFPEPGRVQGALCSPLPQLPTAGSVTGYVTLINKKKKSPSTMGPCQPARPLSVSPLCCHTPRRRPGHDPTHLGSGSLPASRHPPGEIPTPRWSVYPKCWRGVLTSPTLWLLCSKPPTWPASGS